MEISHFCTWLYVYSFKYIFYHLEGFDIAQADTLNEINTFVRLNLDNCASPEFFTAISVQTCL